MTARGGGAELGKAQGVHQNHIWWVRYDYFYVYIVDDESLSTSLCV